jgi:preprotein translocase subunit SecG
MIFTVLLAVHILLALLLIGVILLQQGKGATAGAAFGSGASSTVFGARGSASFLTRLTAILAVLFFSNSLLLAYLYGQTSKTTSLLDQVAIPAPGAPGKADVPTKVDVGELVENATQGKPVDVPAPPPADVPATPAASAPASSTTAPSTPASDVPATVTPPANESQSSGSAPSTDK